MKKEIKFNTRKAAFVELNGICSMSGVDSHDFIEVTEWSNGEGWDICINAVGNTQTFSITWGQFQAMKKLIKKLDKSYESKTN
jgi:hypothetical protein